MAAGVPYLVTLNGSGGAFTNIPCKTICSRMEIIEDGSANAGVAQGLIAQFRDDQQGAYSETHTIQPSAEPLIIGAQNPTRKDRPIIGLPEQNLANGTGAFNYRAADVPVKLKSATASTTIVRVTEYA